MHNDQQGSAVFCLYTCHKRLLPERGNAQTFGHRQYRIKLYPAVDRFHEKGHGWTIAAPERVKQHPTETILE